MEPNFESDILGFQNGKIHSTENRMIAQKLYSTVGLVSFGRLARSLVAVIGLIQLFRSRIMTIGWGSQLQYAGRGQLQPTNTPRLSRTTFLHVIIQYRRSLNCSCKPDLLYSRLMWSCHLTSSEAGSRFWHSVR
jgi:hypothetical protein